ncbi:small guanosine triphosphatase family Ras family protein (macronuclear) [Tetrahymena thermophila SB210]|uniref:Small guanosine triphosphatase family Ras family protein n=2 Tax=Tetrahymena thermophila TaxID=5911 RepID=I7MGB2_TETTS|nr:small guanosine triphosphatase family Ras family protein [Tetrahymena thermophila SB210]EAS01301.2 small guanosine triphosphatase family Ras family protein [Tetrahymena thermophila SB210]BAJ21285.1 Rab-family small GTPase Rab11E [Tetrahymena thermophila]|eukprot:XP_001021546.2 small guanosine triphosphatase family Ras family protein [Tetrahymena thermophila SB210]
MEKDTIATYKIVLVGDTSVGKTHLLKRYSKNELPKNSAPTIGVEFGTKEVTLKDGTKVKAQIWDTAGQERYRGILSLHFRRAVGALLVYDITKEKTYNSIMKWMEDLKYLADPDIVIMLVGNKLDLVTKTQENRKVSIAEAQQFALDNKLIFKETSAVLGTNIKEVFEQLLQEIYNQKKKNPQPQIPNNNIKDLTSTQRQNDDCAC